MEEEKSVSKVYSVYVIGLKLEVLLSAKFRKANPDYIEGKSCYYVGSTALTPEERAEQHRTGACNKKGKRLFNTFARDFFDGLRPSKYKNIPVFKIRDDAKDEEARLAEHLRKKGFGIWYN